MKSFIALTVCVVFLAGGVARALGDCFGKDHHESETLQHDGSAHDAAHGEMPLGDHDPLIHCAEGHWDIAIAATSVNSKAKRQPDGKGVILNDDAKRTHFFVVDPAAPRRAAFGLSSVPIGLSPHLFLSILLI